MTAALVVAIADPHVNMTTAVCPPVVQLDDHGSYHASALQRALWDALLNFAGKVKSKRRKGVPIVLLIVGDASEINGKHESSQLISTNPSTTLQLTIETLSPLIDLADKLYVLRGTSAHVGISAWADEALAEDCDNAVRSSERVASWWQLQKTFGGVRFDVSHHVGMGTKPNTEKNAANQLAFDLTWEYMVKWKVKPPQLALRGHVHRLSDSFDNYDVRAITLPCWCVANEFIYRIGSGYKRPDIGGLIIDCEDGNYTVQKEVYAPIKAPQWQPG